MFFNGIRLTIKYATTSRVNYLRTVAQRRKYSDWYHRQPVRIVNEEEILQYAEAAKGPNEFIEKINNNNQQNAERKPLKSRIKKKEIKRQLKPTPSDLTLKPDGSLNYTELTENDTTLT